MIESEFEFEWLTIDQAAQLLLEKKYLQRPSVSISRAVQHNSLPVKKAGGRVWIHIRDLNEYLKRYA